MSTQSIIQQVQWQDLKVRSEVDVVFEIATKEGWEDCEIFGYGEMIAQPQESTGWKLIPADLYEGSIPVAGIRRIHQIIEAGVRIQGIIIADDERGIETPPAPSKPKVLRSAAKRIKFLSSKALAGLSLVLAGVSKTMVKLRRLPAGIGRVLATGLGKLLVGIGRMLIKLISAVGVIALITLPAYLLIRFPQIIFLVGFMAFVRALATSTPSSSMSYDPKLVVLVDDGTEGTVWVSVLTWYD